jgi:hypothetical protein
VHRDIKPENILLDQKGRIKIADFGIAKVLNQQTQDISLTQATDVVGTAHYMAPEQFEHPQSVDHRADIFSLGVVFYELLTGELPLGKFDPPSQKVPGDARLDDVVLHTLEKEPDRRYQQASQVRSDVETIVATPAESVPPLLEAQPPPPVADPRPSSRPTGRKLALLLGAAGLAAVVLLLGLAGWFHAKAWNRASVSAGVGLTTSNVTWALLNDDQRLVVQWTDRSFSRYDDGRTFDGWPDAERTRMERRLANFLRGPHTTAYYRAINTLAALRSTNAVPLLRKLAFDQPGKNNRARWMAARGLGSLGDRTVVPDLIHLLYYYNANVRWWAQISLVELTGQNFGSDWKAWGRWWNSQHRQPPFSPEITHWSQSQAEPEFLADILAEGDRKWIESLKTHSPAEASAAEAEEN